MIASIDTARPGELLSKNPRAVFLDARIRAGKRVTFSVLTGTGEERFERYQLIQFLLTSRDFSGGGVSALPQGNPPASQRPRGAVVSAIEPR